jgi:hypothetical protein
MLRNQKDALDLFILLFRKRVVSRDDASRAAVNKNRSPGVRSYSTLRSDQLHPSVSGASV